MEIVLIVVSLALPMAGFFFWARGVIKSKKSDIILGFSILALACVGAIVVSDTSAVLSGLGMLSIIFGIETLIVSAFAKPDCPISRKERITLGIGALAVGAFFSMIV
jgi:hypothetical protein